LLLSLLRYLTLPEMLLLLLLLLSPLKLSLSSLSHSVFEP